MGLFAISKQTWLKLIKKLFYSKFITDINECAADNGGCDQICKNVEESFYCDCLDGYVIGPDGESCQDVNECKKDNGGCDHVSFWQKMVIIGCINIFIYKSVWSKKKSHIEFYFNFRNVWTKEGHSLVNAMMDMN